MFAAGPQFVGIGDQRRLHVPAFRDVAIGAQNADRLPTLVALDLGAAEKPADRAVGELDLELVRPDVVVGLRRSGELVAQPRAILRMDAGHEVFLRRRNLAGAQSQQSIEFVRPELRAGQQILLDAADAGGALRALKMFLAAAQRLVAVAQGGLEADAVGQVEIGFDQGDGIADAVVEQFGMAAQPAHLAVRPQQPEFARRMLPAADLGQDDLLDPVAIVRMNLAEEGRQRGREVGNRPAGDVKKFLGPDGGTADQVDLGAARGRDPLGDGQMPAADPRARHPRRHRGRPLAHMRQRRLKPVRLAEKIAGPSLGKVHPGTHSIQHGFPALDQTSLVDSGHPYNAPTSGAADIRRTLAATRADRDIRPARRSIARELRREIARIDRDDIPLLGIDDDKSLTACSSSHCPYSGIQIQK